MRLRIDLAYDGTQFHGWASQPGLRTVQGVLEEWLERILRLKAPASIVVAGRTDAGVHARGQVCHVDVQAEVDLVRLTHQLRRVLPSDVVLQHITAAPSGFDARFSAIWRRYCYRLVDAAAVADPLQRNHVLQLNHLLDVPTLRAGAKLLVGLRDFAPFCKARQGATTIRNLREVEIDQRADGVIEIWLRADAFCHSMVRSLVGALTAVATGQHDLDWLAEVMTSPVRHGGVNVMPAAGLTLEEVGYPPAAQLAERALQSRAMRTPEDTL